MDDHRKRFSTPTDPLSGIHPVLGAACGLLVCAAACGPQGEEVFSWAASGIEAGRQGLALSPSFRPWTAQLLAATHEPELAELRVPAETARAFAWGYVARHGHLPAGFRTCLHLRLLEASGGTMQHFFLFSSKPRCQERAFLGQQITQTRHQAGAPRQGWLARAHAITAKHYYAIWVAAMSFRPPLANAHRGMPLFLLEAPASAAATGCQAWSFDDLRLVAGATPHAALPVRCKDGKKLFSPIQRVHLPLSRIARWDDLAAYRRWRQRALEQPPEYLERHNERWLSFVTVQAIVQQATGGR